MPRRRLAKHRNARSLGAESHHRRLSDHLRVVPYHDLMARRCFQPQRNAVPSDRRAHRSGLRLMPYERHSSSARLLQLPHHSMAEHRRTVADPIVSAESHHRRIRAGHLRVVPYNEFMARRGL